MPSHLATKMTLKWTWMVMRSCQNPNRPGLLLSSDWIRCLYCTGLYANWIHCCIALVETVHVHVERCEAMLTWWRFHASLWSELTWKTNSPFFSPLRCQFNTRSYVFKIPSCWSQQVILKGTHALSPCHFKPSWNLSLNQSVCNSRLQSYLRIEHCCNQVMWSR